MTEEIETDSPKFPVLAITRTRGIHTESSIENLTPKSLVEATQGYYNDIVIVDSECNKWKMTVWRRDKSENHNNTVIGRVFRKPQWTFMLTWAFDGKLNLEELKSIISSRFDSRNDFYSEVGIDLTTISKISSVAAAIEAFNFPRKR